jgi:hypothetical protein
MHIPRGYWHQATRTDKGAGFSLHVTFGFVKRTGVDWVSWVADRSRENEAFRRDLDRWGLVASQATQEADLRNRMARLMAEYPIAAYMSARELERQPPRHVATAGVFGPPKSVVCVADFPPRIDAHEATIEVVAAGKRLKFAERAEPALRALLTGHPTEIAEVAAATGIDAAVLADALIREGVCAELTEALSLGYTGMIPSGHYSNMH